MATPVFVGPREGRLHQRAATQKVPASVARALYLRPRLRDDRHFAGMTSPWLLQEPLACDAGLGSSQGVRPRMRAQLQCVAMAERALVEQDQRAFSSAEMRASSFSISASRSSSSSCSALMAAKATPEVSKGAIRSERLPSPNTA